MDAKDIALNLLERVIDLHNENAALSSILESLEHDRKIPPWRPFLTELMQENAHLRGELAEKYSAIRKQIQDAKTDAELLQLLALMPVTQKVN